MAKDETWYNTIIGMQTQFIKVKRHVVLMEGSKCTGVNSIKGDQRLFSTNILLITMRDR